uniref:Uncharacterized protein n=1 Tax=Oryza brachyantha TaxID=4533 RepID=J3KVB7_ORYBR
MEGGADRWAPQVVRGRGEGRMTCGPREERERKGWRRLTSGPEEARERRRGRRVGSTHRGGEENRGGDGYGDLRCSVAATGG